MHVLSVYGYSNAEQDPAIMSKNEALMAEVFDAAAELGNVPVFICGDFNVLPERSPTIQAALLTGVWRDVAV